MDKTQAAIVAFISIVRFVCLFGILLMLLVIGAGLSVLGDSVSSPAAPITINEAAAYVFRCTGMLLNLVVAYFLLYLIHKWYVTGLYKTFYQTFMKNYKERRDAQDPN